MTEILGIKFTNHPNPVKFISHENWKEGEYPYRRNQK
jgi:Ni,Fe-hydrogenase III component G